MISAGEIDAFRDRHADDFEAAAQMVRAFRTGRPPDRYASTRQMAAIARAVEAYWQIIAWQNQAIEELLSERLALGDDSMSLGTGD